MVAGNITNDVFCTDLIAGQNEVAGIVCVTAGDDGVCISYVTSGGWVLEGTHVWAGTNLGDMPQNRKGNPKVGLFPYGDDALPAGSTFYEVCITYEELGLTREAICAEPDGVVLHYAAHAVVSKVVDGEVVQTETGWANGDPIVDRGSWAMSNSVVLTCDDNPPPPPLDCETAFAVGDTTLNSLSDPLNPDDWLTQRWGWQIGPLAKGESYFTEIYAGAGQNDLSKGTLVGYLDISYLDDNTLVATYQMLEGFTMSETHLYVGDTDTPTAAPGQFGNTHDDLDHVSSDTFLIDVSGLQTVYVVAHAVVCE